MALPNIGQQSPWLRGFDKGSVVWEPEFARFVAVILDMQAEKKTSKHFYAFSECLNQNCSTILNHAKTDNQSLPHHEQFEVFKPPGLFEFYCLMRSIYSNQALCSSIASCLASMDCLQILGSYCAPKKNGMEVGSLHVCFVFFICVFTSFWRFPTSKTASA